MFPETAPTNLNVDLTDEELDALDDFLAIELIKKEPDGGRWMNEVVPSLVKIHAFWRERRAPEPQALTSSSFSFGRGPRQQVVRDAPKVGRNEPCPRGSGKNYKKCCGAGNSTLH